MPTPGLLAVIAGGCATVGFVLLMASAQHKGSLLRILGCMFLSFPLGGFTYLTVGLVTASLRGQGRFVSLPLGGLIVSRAEMFGSLIIWMLVCFFVAFHASRWIPKSQDAR